MSPARKGPMSQRELVPTLIELVDAASAKGKTARRDIAREKLRDLLETANWRTPFVYHNLSTRRCRFIASMGFYVPSQWLLKEHRND